MKTVIAVILIVISYIGMIISGVWCLIELLFFVMNANPFDYLSLWIFISCLVTTLLLYYLLEIMNNKEEESETNLKNQQP